MPAMTPEQEAQAREYISRNRNDLGQEDLWPELDEGIRVFIPLLTEIDHLRSEVARWQAVAIEERADGIAEIPVSHLKDKSEANRYRDVAARELGVEASEWQRIGPEERDAIEEAIGLFNSDIRVGPGMNYRQCQLQKKVDVLRRLLGPEE